MPVRPVTFAFRAVHYGRYGADSEAPQLIKLYAGYPELVHGYGIGSISPADCEFVIGAYKPGFENFESLVVGYYDQGKLWFAGKVRSGFTPSLRAKLW